MSELQAKPCDACGQLIVFLKTARGSTMPVDVESLNETDDSETLFEYGTHVSHFSSCSDPERFRRAEPAPSKWKFAKIQLVDFHAEGDGDYDEVCTLHVAVQGDRLRVRRSDGGSTSEIKLKDALAQAIVASVSVR